MTSRTTAVESGSVLRSGPSVFTYSVVWIFLNCADSVNGRDFVYAAVERWHISVGLTIGLAQGDVGWAVLYALGEQSAVDLDYCSGGRLVAVHYDFVEFHD